MLAQISFVYDIPSDLVTSLSAHLSVTESHNNAAEMFEAYVAAVCFSCLKNPRKTAGDGLDELNAWLWPLFKALAARQYNETDEDDIESMPKLRERKRRCMS